HDAGDPHPAVRLAQGVARQDDGRGDQDVGADRQGHQRGDATDQRTAQRRCRETQRATQDAARGLGARREARLPGAFPAAAFVPGARGRGYAARTVARNLPTSLRRVSPWRATSLAAESTCVEAAPVSDAAWV